MRMSKLNRQYAGMLHQVSFFKVSKIGYYEGGPLKSEGQHPKVAHQLKLFATVGAKHLST